MDILIARLLQPASLLAATLVAALVVLVFAVALAVALGAGVDAISLAPTDTAPFRWA